MNIIVKSRRYVLGESEEHFAIWDVRGGDDPIETFPLTPEGFDAADARFSELKRLNRRFRGIAPRLLWWAVGGGALLWLIGGVMSSLLAGSQLLGRDVLTFAVEAGPVVDALGYRVMIGSLLFLLAFVLVAWERGSHRRGFRVDPEDGTAQTSRFDGALWWSLVVGLGLWVSIGVAVQALAPRGVFGLEAAGPSGAFVVTAVLEGLAFRVWVAALIVLVLRWAQRRWSFAARPSSEGEPS